VIAAASPAFQRDELRRQVVKAASTRRRWGAGRRRPTMPFLAEVSDARRAVITHPRQITELILRAARHSG
jgi:hypothetical protein